MRKRIAARILAGAFCLSPIVAVADPSYQWLRLDRHHLKWGPPEPGVGAVVTYAFAVADESFADARNCRDMRSLDGLLARSGISNALLDAETAAAFGMWQSVADIRFRRIEDTDAAQILIGAQATPRGVAFANVAPSSGTEGGVQTIGRSLICLNPEAGWKVGFGGSLDVFDLRYTLAHEIGHAIGLDHPGPSGQLMSFRYEERFRDLQPGDVAGATALYGPVRRAGMDAVTVAPLATSTLPEVPPAGRCPPKREEADGVLALQPIGRCRR